MRNLPLLAVALLSFAAPSLAQEAGPVFTADQAERGKAAFMDNCAKCHGDALDNGGSPSLVGESFVASWNGKPVWNLYKFAHDNMPMDAPSSLPDQTYADIVAFILMSNGAEAGAAELVPDEAVLSEQVIDSAAE